MERISHQSLNRMRKSYYNIFAFFLEEQKEDGQIMNCLLKWGEELGIEKNELFGLMAIPKMLTFEMPEKTGEALEQIYDLLFMINMDGIVEDVELNVINTYSQKIGLPTHVVNNLLKAMVSASFDGVEELDLRNDIKTHPDVYV